LKYRPFGRLNWKVSILGFGLKGLPIRAEDAPETGEAESIKIIRCAVDHGVNYVDLGYPYDMARHERIVRVLELALRDGYRQRVRISITIPVSQLASERDFDCYLDRQIDWLKGSKADFCLLGRLDRENWPRIRELGFLNRAEQAMSDGRIGVLGFSFHDHLQILRKVLGGYDNWGFCQFQYSYMDITHDPGLAGISYASEKGMAVVVTEPLKAGRLTKDPPESVARIWENAREKRNLAEWGLRFAWNHPGVSTVVSGISTMEQIVENLPIADSAEPESLTVHEELLINRVRDAYRDLRVINCASCRPCMPCPQAIDIPRIFEIYNDAIIYDDVKTSSAIYKDERHNADRCNECGSCERRCSRSVPLPIISWLKTAHKLLTGGL